MYKNVFIPFFPFKIPYHSLKGNCKNLTCDFLQNICKILCQRRDYGYKIAHVKYIFIINLTFNTLANLFRGFFVTF